MPQEIELKLSLPAQHQRAFAALPLLTRYSANPVQVQQLQNRYFDTPDQQLQRHAVALRLRRSGDQFIQTLKTRGSSLGGLHQRREWEWPVVGDRLELALLPVEALPQGVQPKTLAVAFNTDFQRSCWLLDYPFGDQWAKIELVLDSGWVSTAEQRDPISEIELELKDGPIEALFELALQLAAELPLRVSRISKAEKGYRLHRPDHAQLIPPRPTSGRRFDLGIAQGWLDRILALLEGYQFIADTSLLTETELSLEGLTQQLQYANRDTAELSDALEQQQQALQQLLSHPHDETRTQRWLESRSLGQVLLQISAWLFCQGNR